MGSKNRIAKEILPIILKDRLPNQYYIEPFIGGCNTMDKVDGNRIGSDINEYLIELLKAIQRGWIPPDYISENEYKDIKNNKDKYPKYLVGFVGFGCSFGGKWFGGFARNIRKDLPEAEILNKTTRNYCCKSKKNLLKQAPNLKGIEFKCCNYWELEMPENAIIYNDPPYLGTTKYRDNFDHDKFWKWCDEMVLKGHKVYISEYSAPESWNCVWQKTVTSSFDHNRKSGQVKQEIEKLFTK